MSADVSTFRSNVEAARPAAPDTLSRLLWLAALWLAAVSFPAADWADHLGLVPLAALLAALLGMVLAASRFRGRTAFLLAAAYGTFLIGWFLAKTLDDDHSWLVRVGELLGRIIAFLATVAHGEPSRDPRMFVLLMVTLFWFLGAYGSWALFRQNGFWGAVLVPGAALVLNTYFYLGGPRIALYLPAYLLVVLALALRTEAGRRRAIWSRFGASVPGDASAQIALVGLLAGAILIGVAWLLPAFSSSQRAVRAWSQPRGVLSGVRGFFTDLAGGLRYHLAVAGETFGETLELGGGVPPSSMEIFWAEPDAPLPARVRLYWRARVLESYDSGRWQASGGDAEAFDPNRGPLDLPAYTGRLERAFTLTVRVPALHLLYVPSQPAWVNREAEVHTVPAGDNGVDVLDVTAREFVLQGDAYRVLASLSAPRAGALRAAGTDYPDSVVDRYLQLPPTFPASIRALASSVTANAPTPYDKASAVTAWLRANITYQRVISPPPADTDPIEWFLFESRVGFCDYYASAEVLMLRAVNVPARLAVGYSQGEWDPDGNAYYVSAADSHAWPEVYFPSYGWVEFEPTITQPELIRPEDVPAASAGAGGTPAPGEAAALEGGISNGPPEHPPGPEDSFLPGQVVADIAGKAWWVLGAAAAIAVALIVLRSRSLGSPEDVGQATIGETLRRMRWWMATPARRRYRSMVRWGHALGVSPGRSATPYELAEAIGSRLPEVKSQACLVAEAYAGERYGDRPADGRSVGEAWARLRWPFARAWIAHRVALAVPRRFSRSLGAPSGAARGRA